MNFIGNARVSQFIYEGLVYPPECEQICVTRVGRNALRVGNRVQTPYGTTRRRTKESAGRDHNERVPAQLDSHC